MKIFKNKGSKKLFMKTWAPTLFAIIPVVFILFFASYPHYKNYHRNKPCLSITFDDGYEDVYINAFPLLRENNIRATVYVIPGYIGGSFGGKELMNWMQIETLKKNGWEIGPQSLFHRDLTELSSEEIDAEFLGSKLILNNKGYTAKTTAIPYGNYSERIRTLGKKYYSAIRPSVWGANSLENLDRYNLRSYWITNTTKLEDIKFWIDDGKKKKDWVILMFHSVSDDVSYEYTISPDDLKELVTYIKNSNIQTRTISDALKFRE